MIGLIQNCELVITDSGGLQKEAYLLDKYCVTLREETEWNELVRDKKNFLVGSNRASIISTINKLHQAEKFEHSNLYGNGDTSFRILLTIENFFKSSNQ